MQQTSFLFAPTTPARRNLVIEAGAGTGKTTAIVAEVLKLMLERDQLAPERILLMTFTEKAAGEIASTLEKGVSLGKLDAAAATAARKRLSCTRELAEAAREADLVIEAVPERMDLKLEIFGALDAARAQGERPRATEERPEQLHHTRAGRFRGAAAVCSSA